MKPVKPSTDTVPNINLLEPPSGSGSSKSAPVPSTNPIPQRKSAIVTVPTVKKPIVKGGSSSKLATSKPLSKPSVSKVPTKVPVKVPVKAPAKAPPKPPSATSVATNALAALQSKIASGAMAPKKAPEKAAAPAPVPLPAADPEPAIPSPTISLGEVAAGVQYPDASARAFLHIEGAPDITVKLALERFYEDGETYPRVLTMEEKNAVGMPLPVLLYDIHDSNQVFVPITFKKNGQSAFSGNCVMFATIYERPTPGFENNSWIVDLDTTTATCMMRGLKEYTALHVAASDPVIAEIFWRLKWQFPQFEWEPAASADIKTVTETVTNSFAKIKILNLPHAPAHIKEDLVKLPLPKPSAENAVRSARWHKWCDTVKDDKWVHPSGRPPCHPLPPHDKRAEKLGSRTSLTASVNAYLRSPGRIDLKGFSIGTLLQVLVERKPVEPVAEEGEAPKRSAEDDEMAAMLEPPPKPEKKLKKRKLKQGTGLFINGEAEYDDYEDGHTDDEEEGEDGLGDFVRDDDEVLSEHSSMADDLDDAHKKNKKKKEKSKQSEPPKKKQRASVITDSDDDSDEEDGEEDEEEGEESSEEEEMEDSDDNNSDDDDSDDEEDTREVKARAEASDDSGDEEVDRSNSKKVASASAPKKKKQQQHQQSSDKPTDTSGQRSIVSIFAAQQMDSSQPVGKPGLKLGAQKPHKLSAAEKQADASDKGPPVAKNPQRPASSKVVAPPALMAGVEAHEPEASRKEISSRANATWRRHSIADKAKSAIGIILSNKKLSSASPAFAQEIKQGARAMGALMEEFRDNEYKPHWEKCMESMVGVIENMAYVINGLTQNQDKAKDTLEAHGELGIIGAKMLAEMMPDVNELQKRINALAATGNGMSTQFALAVAKAKQAEK